MNANDELFSLCFGLLLTPDTTGLTYRLSDFECALFSDDAVAGDSLEKILSTEDKHIQLIMESFHNRLVGAANAW